MATPPLADVVRVLTGYPTALIYMDESTVKASSGRFFVVGAVKVRRSGQLMRAIRAVRDRHGFHDEFKFSRISRGKFAVFCELIDVLEQSDAHIAASSSTGRAARTPSPLKLPTGSSTQGSCPRFSRG
jgi:hypothetical protein